MVPAVPVVPAGLTFFLDIRDFPARRHFAVPADDASAGERRETEKPNETHHESPLSNEPPSNFRTDEITTQRLASLYISARPGTSTGSEITVKGHNGAGGRNAHRGSLLSPDWAGSPVVIRQLSEV
jgi:hypothetical protein